MNFLAVFAAFTSCISLARSACDNACMPEGNWRLRMDLRNVDWEGAQEGFATVFNKATDEKYAQKIMFHMDPETFTPINDNEFNIKAADGSYLEEFEITNRGTNCLELKSHITMQDGTEIFLVPFTGVEQDANGQPYYTIGVKECTAPGLPPDWSNFMCNEAAGLSMAGNAKRYACMVENYAEEDPFTMCKDLMPGVAPEPGAPASG